MHRDSKRNDNEDKNDVEQEIPVTPVFGRQRRDQEEDMERVEQRLPVHNKIENTRAVPSETNAIDDDDDNNGYQTKANDIVRKRIRIIRILACLVILVFILFLVLLLVFMLRPHNKKSSNTADQGTSFSYPTITNSSNVTNTTTIAPTLAATIAPLPNTSNTIPPSTLPPRQNETIRSCGDFPSCISSNVTIVELVEAASNHTALAEYLRREFNSDLYDYLSSNNHNVTLLAPTDESFWALQPPFSFYLRDGVTWQLHLWHLLGTLILPQPKSSAEIFQSPTLPTYLTSFTLSVNQSNRTIENGASIVTSDIQASNGYIQVPDRLVLQSQFRKSLYDMVIETDYYVLSDYITKFRWLLQASGLEHMLQQYSEDGFTLFVPTDVFQTVDEDYIRNVVLYHMLGFNFNGLSPHLEMAWVMLNNVSAWFTSKNPNNDTYINSAKSVDSYVVQNGFFHVIDQVLIPPNNSEELLQITSNATVEFNVTTFTDIVEHVAHLGNLTKSIAAAVVGNHSELGSYFTGTDYLTVFAPVESAFAPLADTKFFQWLLKPAWLLHLQSLCLHHFTLDAFPNAIGQYNLTMLSGFNLTLDVLTEASQLAYVNETIDGVTVKAILGSPHSILYAPDGVIQFIPEVLLPPWTNQTVLDGLAKIQDVWHFYLLLQLTDLVTLLYDMDGPVTVFAPTNEAMLQMGFLNTTAQEFVSRHVVLGNKYTSVLVGQTVVSLANKSLKVYTNGTGTYIGGALIVQSNILASNGVIHVIDHVL